MNATEQRDILHLLDTLLHCNVKPSMQQHILLFIKHAILQRRLVPHPRRRRDQMELGESVVHIHI